MFNTNNPLYLITWNTLCFSIIGLGFGLGLLQPIFEQDASHLSYLTVGLAFFMFIYTTLICIKLDRLGYPTPSKKIDDIMAFPILIKGDVFVLISLCGTMIGLTMVVSSMVSTGGDITADVISTKIATLATGMKTAFNAPLVGIACKLWAEMVAFILDFRVRQIRAPS